MAQLTTIIERSNFILISSVIRKDVLLNRQQNIGNPYHLALGFCLESLSKFLAEKNQEGKKTYIVFEARGKKEDRDLELEFRRICDGANSKGLPLPFEIILADKKANSSGLQLADLVARPIGLDTLKPGQPNRAFQALVKKFYCSGGRTKLGEGYRDWGLKVFPAPKSEKPR